MKTLVACGAGFLGSYVCERLLAEKIIGLAESKSEIIYGPLPEDDPKRRKPDISKARNVLGWEPKIGLDEGLKKTIEWCGNYLLKA